MTNPLEDFRRETTPDDAISQRLREGLEARLAWAPAPRARWWKGRKGRAALGALAAGLALVVWGAWPRPALEAPPLRFLASPQVQQVALPNDGQLSVQPGSTAALETNASGARVALTSGVVELAVHHVEGKRWVVAVDGFEVTAVGTRFQVKRTGGRPEVTVREGTVRLTGPGLPAAGEAISVVAPTVEVPPVPGPLSPRVTPAPPLPEPRIEPPVDAGHAPRPTSAARWLPLFRELVESGDTAQAQDLVPASAPGQCPGCTAKDLLDLGDLLMGAAQAPRALRAYTQSCTVEPASASCATAQVRLALQAEQDRRLDEALRWASTYLERNPRGAFATELLFRSMEWHLATGQTALARDDAQRVIDRPNLTPARVQRAREVLARP